MTNYKVIKTSAGNYRIKMTFDNGASAFFGGNRSKNYCFKSQWDAMSRLENLIRLHVENDEMVEFSGYVDFSVEVSRMAKVIIERGKMNRDQINEHIEVYKNRFPLAYSSDSEALKMFHEMVNLVVRES